QFFADAQSDHSDQRQGQYLLGETLVTTDQSGHATFSFTYTPQANAPLLSATASDNGNGNTSEFSGLIQPPESDSPDPQSSLKNTILTCAAGNDNGPRIFDPDNDGTNPEQATLNVGPGTPTDGTNTKLSASGTGTNTFTALGTLANLSAAPDGLTDV